MGTGEEQQQQQEGGFQREVDAAEKSLAVVMVAVRRRFKLFLFFLTPQCETFKESGCEGTKNHLDGPKSQKCSEPLL